MLSTEAEEPCGSREPGCRCRRMGPMTARLVLGGLLLACLVGTCVADCAVGLKTPGRTWPAGDIVLEYGSPLQIQCVLNMSVVARSQFSNKNSSDLVFFKGQRQVEPEFVTIVNSTTIQLDVSQPPPENAMYYCKLKLDEHHDKDYEAVCLNKVVVGFKPMEPRNFSCVSRNWENMTCEWEPPENFVDTTYSISFKLPGRAGGRMLFPCPSEVAKEDDKPLKDKPKNSCTWAFHTNPIYRQLYEYYTFYLTGENVLGNWTGSYKFHHFAHVIPAKPTNLTVVNKTLDSALLHWEVPFPMQIFPAGLHHRVSHQNEWDSRDTWQIIDISEDIHNAHRFYNLTGLRYANAIYDVRVFIKSAVAVGEDKWSNFSDVTFRTPAIVPGSPPRTDIGSFEVVENQLNRDIYLYWQTIPRWLENGNDFHYQLSHVEDTGKRVYLEPSEVMRTYARFRGLGHTSSYHFEIYATNEVGVLEIPAKIYVPSRQTIPNEPVAFTKIAFEDGLYELSWKPPIHGAEDITNYTIFWCENERDRPYQCTGYLDWVHVSKLSTVHNITVPNPNKVYQFAISANTARASSGMMWASCTVIHNKVVGKMKSVWINRIGSTVIEVGWKLDCSDRIGIVEGFKIYYCPIVSPYNLNCRGPKLNTTIKADLNTIRGEVTGLKPYTTYMIAVAVLTKNGEGQHSDPLYNTTLESPPSEPPYDLVIRNVTNSTMFVEWKAPIAMNGVLRYYVVQYNEHKRKVEEEERMHHVQLDGLLSHVNYSVSVAACTVECSKFSKPMTALTDIGVPDRIVPRPYVRFYNSSIVRVTWDEPSYPAGPINYYQIKGYDEQIHNATSREAFLSIPDCTVEAGKVDLYKFWVRAVNIAHNNEHLVGNWSESGEGNCFNNGPSYMTWVVIWVIGSIFGIAFVFCIAYSSKRVWLKCKAMQDVEVKLPPGLAPNIKLLQKGDQHQRQSSADSSGCSTGQESVTSSLTSDSQVSSDSGTEVDPVMPKKQLLMEAPGAVAACGWESSLRQRNVSGASKPTNEAPRWDSYVKVSSDLLAPTASDSSSLARSTPNLNESVNFVGSQPAWSSTGYISMPSSEEMSSNPSPVPKDNPAAGSYSIVGVMPKTRSKSEEETISLNKSKTANESKPTTNPYVSLISLEQKSKAITKRALDSLRAFDELSFDNPLSSRDVGKQQSTSRAYVQTSFLEPKQSTFDTTTRQPLNPVVANTSIFSQTCLAEDLSKKLSLADSKPYVMVASIPKTKPMLMHAVPTIAQSQSQCFEDQEKISLYPSLDLETKDDASSSSSSDTSGSPNSSLGLCWQPSGKDDDVKQQLQPELSGAKTTSSGYVTLPEQQLKPAKPLQQLPSDEQQYSKVAVVPRVMHQH